MSDSLAAKHELLERGGVRVGQLPQHYALALDARYVVKQLLCHGGLPHDAIERRPDACGLILWYYPVPSPKRYAFAYEITL